MKYYKYIFYLFYHWAVKNKRNEMVPHLSSFLHLFILFYLNCLTLFLYTLKIFHLLNTHNVVISYLHFLIPALIFIYHYYLSLYKKKYVGFISEFDNENKNIYYRRLVYVWIYILLTILSFMSVMFLNRI